MKRELIGLDKKLSWVLFAVTLVTMFFGYTLTRFGSQLVTPEVHVGLNVVFAVLLVFHTIVVTLVIRDNWITLVTKIIQKEASNQVVIKFIQNITGKLSLFFAILQIINGLDYFYNFRTLFSLMQHVQFDILFYLSFLAHMTAGSIVMLKRRRVDPQKAKIIVGLLVIGLLLFVGVFESGFI